MSATKVLTTVPRDAPIQSGPLHVHAMLDTGLLAMEEPATVIQIQ